MSMIKVLYNNSCGDWSFSDEFYSDEFKTLFKEKYGKELNDNDEKMRYDKDVIELFEEIGSKKSSHPSASLKITNYPEELINFMKIQVCDYREHICFCKETAYKYLLEEIIESENVSENIKKKYENIEILYKNYGF